MRRLVHRLLLVTWVASATACGGAGPDKRPPVVKTPPAARRGPTSTGPEMLPARVLTQLDDENASPYFARRPNGEGVLFFGSRGRWRTLHLSEAGVPDGDTIDVAPAAAGVALAALRPSGDGYLATWVEPVARNHAVMLLDLDAKGRARGAPTLATQLSDDVSWVDLLPNAKGALLLWEIPRDERSDLYVMQVMGGKAAGAPVAVARAVLGWESLATEQGAALVTITASAAAAKPDEPRAKVGRVQLTELDAAGKVSATVQVSAEPTAQIDVEIAQAGGRYVLAWTDERDIDPCVELASVAPGGKLVAPPHRATPPVGEQALVALVSGGGDRTLLAWEDLLRVPSHGRLIHLASVDAQGAVGKDRASMVFGANGPPDLAPDGDGFAAVTLAPASLGDAAPGAGPAEAVPGGARGEAPIWPTFVRFGPDLRVLASEPIRAAPFATTEGVPYLTRGLSCPKSGGGACTTLASGSGAKAPLALVTLPTRPTRWRAPAWADAVEPPPRAVSVAALFDGEHLADVAAQTLSDGSTPMVAWITYYLEGAIGDATPKKGKKGEDPFAATLGIRPIVGGSPGKITLLSRRALSIGGVALAAAPGDKKESLVAWSAREQGAPQVFVTKVGPDGAKIAQKGLTVVPRKARDGLANEVSDVAVAWADDGWIVAWVDTRDQNPEIYVAKVDRDLKKVVPDRRITDAPGDSSEVQIAVRGKDTFLVWSDARQEAEGGDGDIYLARLETKTLKKLGEETRIFASAAHSRTPTIASSAEGLLVAWLEEPVGEGPARSRARATQGGPDQPGVRVARIDEKGSVIGAPVLVGGDKPATSVAIACPGPGGGTPHAGPGAAGKPCRGVLTSSGADALVLSGFEITPGAPAGRLRPLAALTGGVTEDVAPAFASSAAEQLFFADDAVGGSGRLRWMTIAWP